MTPTKIILEKTATHVQLRVLARDTAKGYVVIESTPYRSGNSIPGMRKHAQSYAKLFAIPFCDQIACGVDDLEAAAMEERERAEEEAQARAYLADGLHSEYWR